MEEFKLEMRKEMSSVKQEVSSWRKEITELSIKIDQFLQAQSEK
jgi:hypothetical protein